MKKKFLLPFGLLLFGGCLLPRYDVDPLDEAQGGTAATAAGTSSTAGAPATAGASVVMSGGTDGSAGTLTGEAGMADSDGEACAAGSKRCEKVRSDRRRRVWLYRHVLQQV